MCCIASLTGCSPYTLIDSEVYNNADLRSYSTFRIVQPSDGHLPPGMQSVTYYNIAAAIRDQMTARGFREDPASPLLINFGLTVHREIQTEPLMSAHWYPYPGPAPVPPYAPWFMYPRSYYWPANYQYTNAKVITGIYHEGVLTVDMVNIVDKVPLYSASVGAVIDSGSGVYRNLQGINEAVTTLFSRFPVPLPKNK